MIGFFRNVFVLSLALILTHAVAFGKAEKKKEADSSPPPEKTIQTRHTFEVDGRKYKYIATAAEIRTALPNEDIHGRFFHTAYTLADSNPADRPITFVFNGGPGAGSVWLHMGGLGPRRVAINPDGTPPPPPARYGDNPYTWLTFTDLVFVDPIGTGFSRSEPDDEQSRRKFFGVRQDMASVAEFIRIYLSRNQRWSSPKFLVGESYGTTRVASLAWNIHQTQGIDLNGVILISPVLLFDTITFTNSNDLPYILFLPTYAAIAHHHKRLPAARQDKSLDELLGEVESFCRDTYGPLLFRGDDLSYTEHAMLAYTLAEFTGLPEKDIHRMHYRIPWADFTKRLLDSDQRIVARMDGTITGLDPEPQTPYPVFDPSLEGMFGTFSTAVNAYLRNDLKFETDLAYVFLSGGINGSWDWRSGMDQQQGFVDVTDNLRAALSVNETLRVFIANGIYDLATPFFASDYTINRMRLGDRRSRVSIQRYPAGHMIFTHLDALAMLTRDASEFYKTACGGETK